VPGCPPASLGYDFDKGTEANIEPTCPAVCDNSGDDR